MEELMCSWDTSYWFFSENVPLLLYYSHVPAIVIALMVGIYVFSIKKNAISGLLLALFSLFSTWAIFAVLLWATNRTDVVMFFWSLTILVEPIIYTAAFYLFYVFVFSKYPNFKTNLIVALLLLPLIALTPTSQNLLGVNLYDCAAWEGPLALYYTYFLEGVFILGILAVLVVGFRKLKTRIEKFKISYFALGLIAFLVAFTSGNIIGSVTGDWDLAQYGLFGMPIFIAFLAYLIVQYKVFNLKIFGAQVLVLALWVLIGSLLFVVQSEASRIVSALTLALAIGFGFLLIRSVKREIEAREKIQKLATDLKRANTELEEAYKLQTEFLSFASHQIKNPLSGIKGYASLLMEGDYGELKADIKDAVRVIFTSAQSLIETVQQFLDSAKIEQGGMKYDFQTLDLKEAVKDVVESLMPTAKEKGVELNISMNEAEEYKVKADRVKIRQVVLNITDNAIKYTPKGSVTVGLVNKPGKVLFSIKDTGVGIEKAEIAKLFAKFARATGAEKVNVSGSGLGMYLAKKIVEGHGGRIWVESEGKGKGSQFYVEFDRANETVLY